MKNVYQKLIEQVFYGGAKTATAYISPKETVKATLRQKSQRQTEILVTIGRPNYKERQFIKTCVKAGEQFPVSKIQLKFAKPKQR